MKREVFSSYQKRTQKEYSLELKLQVVVEVEKGEVTCNADQSRLQQKTPSV
jgi:hypothetical protein